MRALLAIFFALLSQQGMMPGPGTPHSAGGGGGGSIACVQSCTGVTQASGNPTATFSFGSNTGAGHTIIAWAAAGAAPSITSDSQGLTWHTLLTGTVSNGIIGAIFCATGTSAAAESITFSGGSGTVFGAATEFSGVGCTTDGTAISGTGVSSTPDSGALTTANAADLLLGVNYFDRALSPSFAPTGTGTWSNVSLSGSTNLGAASYQIVSSTGAYHYQGDCGGGNCPAFYGAGIAAVH